MLVSLPATSFSLTPLLFLVTPLMTQLGERFVRFPFGDPERIGGVGMGSGCVAAVAITVLEPLMMEQAVPVISLS